MPLTNAEKARRWREKNPDYKPPRPWPEYSRQWRLNHPAQNYRNSLRWMKANPEKISAHQRVKYAIKTGRLKRQPCERCGKPNAHAHHFDYAKPFEVTWLCAGCHRREHIQNETMFMIQNTPTNGRGDLPGIEGPGVAAPRIPEIDRLVDKYVKARDFRMEQTKHEVAAKAELISALHAHGETLATPEGDIVYRYDDLVVTLATGKEKLKVRTAGGEGGDDDE